METEKIEAISKAATAVAADYEANQAAIGLERDTEAAVLELAIKAALPGLKAVAGRVQTKCTTRWHNGYSSDVKEKSTDRFIALAGDGATADHPRDDRGGYEGYRLLLSAVGRLFEVTYTGHWSRWQGEGGSLETEWKELTPRQAMDVYDLEDLVDAITKAVQGVASRAEKTKAALERADRLQAILKLCK